MSKSHIHSFKTQETSNSIHETFHVVISDMVELFVAVSFAGLRDEAMAKNIMYTIIQSLQDTLISSTDKAIYERFEEGVKTLNSYLSHKHLEDVGMLSAAIGLLHEHKMHITKTGLAEIYLLRKDSCTNITENFNGEEETNEYFENIATGELETNDHVLISTDRLTSYLTEEELCQYFQSSLGNSSFMNLERFLKDAPEAHIGFIGFTVHEIASDQEQTKLPIKATSLPDLGKFIVKKHKQYMSDPRMRSKYYTLGALIVLILLVISITSSLSGNQNAQLKEEFATQFNTAKNELALAKNMNIKGDREGAREHLLTAKQITTSIKSQNVAIADVDDLMKEIEAQEDVANKVTRVDTSAPFITLSDSLQGDTAKGIISTPNGLMAYSSTGIYGPFINQETNASTGKKIETQDLIVNAIYFDDTKGLALKLSPDKIAEFVGGSFLFLDSSTTTWKPGNLIDDFGNNIYVLGEQQIWKYTKNRDTYRGPEGWLKKVDPDLANAVSFAIDGSIYTLQNTGEIKLYFKNQLADLELVDLPQDALSSVNEESKILTQPGYKRVYVLNHETSTIISFVKVSGKNQLAFEKQFYFPQTDIADFDVSSNEEDLYVLSKDGMIYKSTL